MTFAIHVPGDPRPAGRPRFSGRRVHMPAADIAAKELIQQHWMLAGQPRHKGLYAATVQVTVARPKSHWRKAGEELTAAGRGQLTPVGDVDNFAKLAIDALVQCGAVDDDRYMVELRVWKLWAHRDAEAGLHIAITDTAF